MNDYWPSRTNGTTKRGTRRGERLKEKGGLQRREAQRDQRPNDNSGTTTTAFIQRQRAHDNSGLTTTAAREQPRPNNNTCLTTTVASRKKRNQENKHSQQELGLGGECQARTRTMVVEMEVGCPRNILQTLYTYLLANHCCTRVLIVKSQEIGDFGNKDNT